MIDSEAKTSTDKSYQDLGFAKGKLAHNSNSVDFWRTSVFAQLFITKLTKQDIITRMGGYILSRG